MKRILIILTALSPIWGCKKDKAPSSPSKEEIVPAGFFQEEQGEKVCKIDGTCFFKEK